ncbi:hypothetical protein B7494_g2002 [Chlorociboria aeruginascens]|nr:hypothetical protein B7494_g2002 [Chlorociboria aeruginascens]
MAGLLTAELDMFYEEELDVNVKLPWDSLVRQLRKRPILRQVLLHLMLIAALYLGGQPAGDHLRKDAVLGTCRGWRTLSWLIPVVYEDTEDAHRWFWLFWAAWLMVFSCKEIGWVKELFETGLSQYLGKHSYALYLVHGPMIGLLSERLFYLTGVKVPFDSDSVERFGHLTNKWSDASWWPFPTTGTFGLEPNFVFCVVVSLPVFLYISELTTKMIDGPSIKVAKWIYVKLKEIR